MLYYIPGHNVILYSINFPTNVRKGNPVHLFRCSAEASNLYFVGERGEDCDKVCQDNQMMCTGKVDTGDNYQKFRDLGIRCRGNSRAYKYP